MTSEDFNRRINAFERELSAFADRLEKYGDDPRMKPMLDNMRKNLGQSVHDIRETEGRYLGKHTLSPKGRSEIYGQLHDAIREGDAGRIRDLVNAKTCGLKFRRSGPIKRRSRPKKMHRR
jgi:hypothetical protein